jgi:tRNA threonylcarbamoyladenosine biosynthesis protein TsaB
MLLLVTDTSGKHGSVALARAESEVVEVIESVPFEGGTFSAQLVPQIAKLLAKYRFSKRDIGAFIVISGPGSFTGLRVGLAAIKAFAEILEKPIVPVSLLEVIAVETGVSGQVMAALDAGRGEIYVGEYELTESARLIREQLLTKEEFLFRVRGMIVATPDELVVRLADEVEVHRLVRTPRPDLKMIAQVGWRKLHAGQTVSPEQLDANYIRRSDAEIFAKK